MSLIKENELKVVDIKELEDGSAIFSVDMHPDVIKLFFDAGIDKLRSVDKEERIRLTTYQTNDRIVERVIGVGFMALLEKYIEELEV